MSLSLCNHKECTNYTKGKNKKYCSSDCYHKSRTTKSMIFCECCGIAFMGVPGKSKYHNKVCSNSATKSKEKVKKHCLYCNKVFFAKQCRAEYALFHSYECFNIYRRNGVKGDVEITCEYCGVVRAVPYIHRMKRFCNRSCANSCEFNAFYGIVGQFHPTYGRHAWNRGLTAKTDERVAALGKKISEFAKKQFLEGKFSNVGKNNPNYGRTRETRTLAQLENYSKAAIKRIIDGTSCRHPYLKFKRGYYTSKKTGATNWYRSSYELRMMKYLDASNDVVDWVYEPFSIKIEEGKRYLPDFLVTHVDCHKELLEVKAKDFLKDKKVIQKCIAAENFCAKLGILYKICTLDDIKKMENSIV